MSASPDREQAGREEGAVPPSSLAVHLLAGLPTEAVAKCFAGLGGELPVVPLAHLAEASLGAVSRVGVVIPPFVEPSLLVERWLEGNLLQDVFARPAHVAGIATFVDVDEVVGQIGSGAPLSQCGWGQGAFDRRTVADIVVGQIESATCLVPVGASPVPESLARSMGVLNPQADCFPIRAGSSADLIRLVEHLDGSLPGGAGPGETRADSRPGAVVSRGRSAAVVPPWQKVLQGDCKTQPGHLVYRRVLPFDSDQLRRWLLDPPRGILRAKGRLWFASDPDQSFGYSCAGSVHRLFPAGRWWASAGAGSWPVDANECQRLLECWDPRFGDRRQELVFSGVDLDPEEVFEGLDRCLIPAAAVDEKLVRTSAEGIAPASVSGPRIH